MLHLDVLMISDFRLPGGTSHSTAQELAIHSRMGLRTGLVQSNSRLTTRALPWSSVVVQTLLAGSVEPILPGVAAHAQLALLRHPIAVESMPDLSKFVSVDQALIIANQPAVRPDGSIEYDIAAITQTVRERLGVDPTWAPIGPVVRASFAGQTDDVRVLDRDWTNVFAHAGMPMPRDDFHRDRPRIGRHSRPQPAKWLSSPEEIVQAYPTSERYDVRILGGADPAVAALGYLPEHWTVHPFGSLEPTDFLRGVDFWVYFHHPEWSEAYGRAIMEALWSGAVVILPPYLRVTYGEAAIYATPAGVQRIIEEFHNGARDFARQSALGQSFASAYAPQVHVDRMRSLLDAMPSTAAEGSRGDATIEEVPSEEASPLSSPRIALTTRRPAPVSRFQEDQRPRALFVTSNGAGMGHLTRMLALARAAAEHVNPIFFSMSQGLDVVATAGFPYEYVPFNSALQTKSALWHEYFKDRLLAAIDHHRAEIVLFDGTWPYRGMLSAFEERDILRVWVRRGMWKPNISPEQLLNAPHFDLVIEPGEYARAYDVGATTRVENAQGVDPMTVLSEFELLSRDDALAELGLSNEPGRKYALVTLGAGNINDVSSTQAEVLAAISRQPGWQPILTRPPISSGARNEAVPTVSTFPLARYTRAFDFAVSATGYNSFSEWMSGGLPTIWIPNMSTMTDDQDARGRWAHDFGLGIRVSEDDHAEIHAAVDRMCDDEWRRAVAERLQDERRENGAPQAAALLFDALDARQRSRGVRR